jgi:hypothetical protein
VPESKSSIQNKDSDRESPATIRKRRRRFGAKRVQGLPDEPWSGTPRTIRMAQRTES